MSGSSRQIVALAFAWALAGVGARCVQAQGNPHPEVIYGDDDRLDLYQVKNPKLKGMAASTVALFPAGNVTVDAGRGVAALATSPYGQRMSLCKEEPFYEQQTGAFCSGSLVGPDTIMTAGHCVESQASCEGTKFVFGFAVQEAGKQPSSVPAGEVYGCKKLLGREEIGTGQDWALIQVDRKVTGHKVLELNKTGKIANGAPLIVIGHPSGLPTKVAGGAKVRDASPEGYFVANLDTYGGNSGSAVFNGVSGLVEGILVRGEQDFEWKGSCRVSKVCANDACRGEDVTKVSYVLGKIPGTNADPRRRRWWWPFPWQLEEGQGSQQSLVRSVPSSPAFRRLVEAAQEGRSFDR